METNVLSATSPIQAEASPSGRIFRRTFLPPYASPITNYRKLWPASPPGFWAAFGVLPGHGGTINQLGTKPVSSVQTAFQEVGFGYTFKTLAVDTDYWFDVEVAVGPSSSNGSKNTIELQLLGSNVNPVVIPITSRFMTVNATLDAYLKGNTQYMLLMKSKVEITVGPGQTKYGEVIAAFNKLVVSRLLLTTDRIEAAPDPAVDLEAALKSMQAGGGDCLFQAMSYEDIAKAGPFGVSGSHHGE